MNPQPPLAGRSEPTHLSPVCPRRDPRTQAAGSHNAAAALSALRAGGAALRKLGPNDARLDDVLDTAAALHATRPGAAVGNRGSDSDGARDDRRGGRKREGERGDGAAEKRVSLPPPDL